MVENGSLDKTFQIAQDFAASNPQLRVLQNAQSGKGRAVKQGMLAAQGEYRFMCDVDLSMPVDEINRFLPPALKRLISPLPRVKPREQSVMESHITVILSGAFITG